MARKDNTFTDEDIHRLFCNNLAPVEKIQARLRILFQACEGDNCPLLLTILNILSPLCKLSGTGVFKLLKKVPFVGTYVASIVDISCSLEPYLKLGYDLLCKDGKPLEQLTYSTTPLLQFINNNLIELQQIPLMIEEHNEELERDVYEYLTASTLQITMQ